MSSVAGSPRTVNPPIGVQHVDSLYPGSTEPYYILTTASEGRRCFVGVRTREVQCVPIDDRVVRGAISRLLFTAGVRCADSAVFAPRGPICPGTGGSRVVPLAPSEWLVAYNRSFATRRRVPVARRVCPLDVRRDLDVLRGPPVTSR